MELGTLSQVLGSEAMVLAIAALLDYLIGDPWNWLHPVQVIGGCINQSTRLILKSAPSPQSQRLLGMAMAIGIIGGSGLASWLIIDWGRLVHPMLGLAIATILLASCFAGRSLRNAAEDVLQPLSAGDLAAARARLALYVGRDTDRLSEPELFRATFETVSENATDGVMAPLFYAIVGSVLPLGAAPLAIAYKAASTLDSTIGYREAPYTYVGWFSARLEDGLTWIPCRLTVLTIALLSGKPRQVLEICRRDAPHDPSPNAGWSECAYAAALGVQVGGINWYRGVAKHKPRLGDPTVPITAERIRCAARFTRFSFLIWLGLSLVAGVGIG